MRLSVVESALTDTAVALETGGVRAGLHLASRLTYIISRVVLQSGQDQGRVAGDPAGVKPDPVPLSLAG